MDDQQEDEFPSFRGTRRTTAAITKLSKKFEKWLAEQQPDDSIEDEDGEGEAIRAN